MQSMQNFSNEDADICCSFKNVLPNFQEIGFSVKSHTDSLFVWHARLGHLPFTKLKRLGLLTDDVSGDVINQCLVCSKAR